MYGSARLRTSGFTKGAAFFGHGAASAAVGVAAAARAPAARAPFSSSLRLGTVGGAAHADCLSGGGVLRAMFGIENICC